MKKIYSILVVISLSFGWACESDSEFLERPPAESLTVEQAFSDPAQVLSILANLYGRQFSVNRLSDWQTFADFNDVLVTADDGLTNLWHTNNSWPFGGINNFWSTWDYAYIRELNLFLERIEESTISEDLKAAYAAEARFLRALYYFELAKLYGGVPIVLESQTYDFSGDPSYLQVPRSTEAEIYDFVIQEADALSELLPMNADSKSRASAGAALAMKAQAAVYAGSLARYGANTPSVSLPGNVIGIPAERAEGYYQTALEAAQEIISGSAGGYALYNKIPTNLSENFAAIFYDKNANPETIFIEEYLLKFKVHYFTGANQPRYGAEEEEGGALNPSLNLVQEFELLDNTFAPLPTVDANGDPIYYENQLDIFANRDARLAGTVILPGSTFKSRPVDIWAGLQLGDGTVITGSERGQLRDVPGSPTPIQVVGFDGPVATTNQNALAGFYVRKYQDPAPGSGRRGTQSDVSRIKFRYAEILLIAAEAAFELNQPGIAADYMNEVRTRAGFTIPLTAADITLDRIIHERRVEFALEGQYFMDLKRFRIAHEIFDGISMNLSGLRSNIGSATKRSTQPWGLWPYKIYDPGSANHGKWIFKETLSNRVTAADNWQLGNYYSIINNDILNNNPKLLRQPLQ
ncbi:RagB/SusD family nutrient uptake outer membrane protein [Catalinimonas niigatensis]|uniref:RagB/SusD family nutrient uptake outer membrane protein n=1 Tax=Catalinimonas niigatensis TaxID=1397264 RepID=UPI002665E746|nr:RagB/SusD family nutrient uptake outer membrane protein [Catalinimonas niigatensis]WPP50776.1 RagB/SusD family nutrient uptake outer membrane protein [Catalinimonas niigatensis]